MPVIVTMPNDERFVMQAVKNNRLVIEPRRIKTPKEKEESAENLKRGLGTIAIIVFLMLTAII